jgi:hypothetical protein
LANVIAMGLSLRDFRIILPAGTVDPIALQGKLAAELLDRACGPDRRRAARNNWLPLTLYSAGDCTRDSSKDHEACDPIAYPVVEKHRVEYGDEPTNNQTNNSTMEIRKC